MLHPDWMRIIRRIRRNGAIATLITNGYLLTAERIRRLNCAGLDYLQISIDNVSPDETSKKSLKVLGPQAGVVGGIRAIRGYREFGLGQPGAKPGGRARHRASVRGRSDSEVRWGFFTMATVSSSRSRPTISAIYRDLLETDQKMFAFAQYDRFQRNIAQGLPNRWHCRAGGRFLYICEDGLVHYCSQQRGRPGIPLERYTRADLEREAAMPKDMRALLHHLLRAPDRHARQLPRKPAAGLVGNDRGSPGTQSRLSPAGSSRRAHLDVSRRAGEAGAGQSGDPDSASAVLMLAPRAAEWLSIAAFAGFMILGWRRGLNRARLTKIVAIGVGAIGVTIFGAVTAPARDWVPCLLIFLFYSQAGQFVTRVDAQVEARLERLDRQWVAPCLEWCASQPFGSLLFSCLELAYCSYYVSIPFAAGALYWCGKQRQGGFFGIVVLAAAYGSCGMLAFVQTRPPRAIGEKWSALLPFSRGASNESLDSAPRKCAGEHLSQRSCSHRHVVRAGSDCDGPCVDRAEFSRGGRRHRVGSGCRPLSLSRRCGFRNHSCRDGIAGWSCLSRVWSRRLTMAANSRFRDQRRHSACTACLPYSNRPGAPCRGPASWFPMRLW